ncbi:hypothetical protein [Fusibacter sp. JL216-2]|uniref:hypothetical protein n=1 Tax=Fusibacter sp. JL216-2 TaxID=3071453 RepID=UPI003D34A276
MAKKKGFDAILGVSKKMIHSDVSKLQDKKSEEAKQQLSSITQKMKEKSEELSSKVIKTSTENSSMPSSDADDKICLSDAEASAEDVCGPSTSDSENVLDETTDELSDEAIKKRQAQNQNSVVDESRHTKEPSDQHISQSDYLDHLHEEIKFLKEQLEVKDHQLNKKDELILNFQVLLKSEQDKVLRLESSLETENRSEKERANEKENKWLVRIFGKKTR